jgi:hypothetical protein
MDCAAGYCRLQGHSYLEVFDRQRPYNSRVQYVQYMFRWFSVFFLFTVGRPMKMFSGWRSELGGPCARRSRGSKFRSKFGCMFIFFCFSWRLINKLQSYSLYVLFHLALYFESAIIFVIKTQWSHTALQCIFLYPCWLNQPSVCRCVSNCDMCIIIHAHKECVVS